jgi:hypothetical protein
VALGIGGGGAFGLGTAIARGGDALDRASGVSDGVAEVFLCGLGDLSPAVFFFFFVLGEGSFSAVFFLAFGFGVASGVSLGVGDASDSSAGFFFAFAFGFSDGEDVGVFFFLCGDVLGLGVGLGVSSGDDELTARAFRIRVGFSSSVCCA